MFTIKGLTPLEHFRLRVAAKPEIIEDEIAPDVIVFSVMKGIGTAETYNDPWSREARGITFCGKTGEIIGRPFHKFFNVNERETTQVHNLDWKEVTRVMDKRDGSMIHPVKVGDGFKLKSKKVFDSSVAVAAEERLRTQPGARIKNLIDQILKSDQTPIFEFTSPDARIVLGYEDAELQLLHIRDNKTGAYMPGDFVKNIANNWGVKVVEEVKEFNSFEEMLEAAKTRENTEGWVIQFRDGEMVKIKTEWYMKRHRAMTYFRERDIALLAVDEQLDDVIAMLAGDGIDVEPVREIERRYSSDMRGLIEAVDALYEADRHMEARHVAAKHHGTPLFGLVMARYNGKKPKYKEHFLAHMLKQNYGLKTIGSLTGFNKGDADAEDQD